MATDSFNTNKIQITTNVNEAYTLERNVSQAEALIDQGKTGLVASIDTISRTITDVNTKIAGLQKSLESDKVDLESTKQTVVSMEKDLEKERVLNEIRKEQAQSLAAKGAGNYHSSWMALYRPLKEESRVGLIVAAIGFFIVTVAVLVYATFRGMINLGSLFGISKDAGTSVGIPDLFSGFTQQKNRLFN